MYSNIFLTYVFLVSILRFTLSHTPLEYRCMFRTITHLGTTTLYIDFLTCPQTQTIQQECSLGISAPNVVQLPWLQEVVVQLFQMSVVLGKCTFLYKECDVKRTQTTLLLHVGLMLPYPIHYCRDKVTHLLKMHWQILSLFSL